MKIWGLFIVLSISFGLSAETLKFKVKNVSQKQFLSSTTLSNEKTISFSIKSLEIEAEKYQKENLEVYNVSHDDFSVTSKPGEPQRIFKSGLYVGTPDDFQISVNPGESYYFRKTIAPAKKWPCRCEKDNETEPKFVFNKDSFRKSQQEFYKMEYLGDFRGAPLTKITFFPMKTWGTSGFEVFPEVSFQIKSNNYIKEANDLTSLYEKLVNKKYLIIAANKYHKDLLPLIDWRTKQGFTIELVSQEKAGDSFEAIKETIHSIYKKSQFSYALLVGSEESFPTEYVPTSSDNQTPSDLKYFTMGGSKDDVPDVFYGRMVVANNQDLKNQIKKIFTFEKRTYLNSESVKNIIGIASNEGSNPSDVDYIRKMQKPLIQKGKNGIEFLQDSTNSRAANINQAFSEGSFWVNYIGHGSGDSWPSIYRGEYSVDNIKQIQKGNSLPVIIDVACQNGRFSLNKRLGERFMNEVASDGSPIGAVAYYGGSVDISWHPPAIMAVAINDLMVKGNNKDLGSILLAGQMHLYNNYSDRQSSRENFIWYHLFGDPALQVDLSH